MTIPKDSTDDCNTIRPFIAQMSDSSQQLSNGTDASATPNGQGTNGLSATNGVFTETVITNGVTTQPIDIPIGRNPDHASTPTRNSPVSPEIHPISSPRVSGLMPPQNTPKTQPASPRTAPVQTHDEDVGDAIADYVRNMDGKPLSASIWAPKSGGYQHSLLRGSRTPSRELKAVSVVQPNPAINESFARMSFKAADSDDEKSVSNLIGDRVTRRSSTSSKVDEKQDVNPPLSTTELEADLVAMPDRGSVMPPRSTRTKYAALTVNECDSKSPALASAGSNFVSKETTPNKSSKKDKEATPSPGISVPPHLRTSSGAMLKSAEDVGSKVFGTASRNITPVPSQVALPRSPSTSHPKTPSEKDNNLNAADNSATLQKDFPFKKGPNSETADISSTAHTHDGLLSTLKALQSSEELDLEAHRLLEELTNRVVNRMSRQPSVAAAPAEQTVLEDISSGKIPLAVVSTSKAAVPKLPGVYLDKRATKPKSASQGYSTPKAADATSTAPAKSAEDLEHKAFFAAWPQLEQRDRPTARIRTIIIKGLPPNATPSFVASLVYGGALEEIHMREGSATVRFLDAEDCKKFYDDTSNGIVYGKDLQGREQVVFIELAQDVDVIGGMLKDIIDTGVTRCVRAVGLEDHYGIEALRELGQRKNRKVESVEDGQTPGGTRTVAWRFCKIEEAYQFRAALGRDQEWEQCNIHYAADPCATATGVHFEN